MHDRFAHRVFLAVDVALHYNGVCVGNFRTRDIDRRAVFIEAAGCDLKQQDVVEMRFVVHNGTRRTFKCKGVVIRCADQGIVVAFATANAFFFHSMEELLTGPPPPKRAADIVPTPDGQLLARRN